VYNYISSFKFWECFGFDRDQDDILCKTVWVTQ